MRSPEIVSALSVPTSIRKARSAQFGGDGASGFMLDDVICALSTATSARAKGCRRPRVLHSTRGDPKAADDRTVSGGRFELPCPGRVARRRVLFLPADRASREQLLPQCFVPTGAVLLLKSLDRTRHLRAEQLRASQPVRMNQ